MSEIETINFRGVDFEVEFDYQPAEQGDLEYPGCHAEVEAINELKHKGTCFIEFVDDFENEIKDLIYEKLRN
jgi:hypothetical protein